MRKTSAKDANTGYVQKLRVPENATNEEIQTALYKLFQSSPQGSTRFQDQSSPQGNSVLTKHPQDAIIAMNDQASPQGLDSRPSIIAATAISKIQLNDTIKNSITSALQREAPFSEI